MSKSFDQELIISDSRSLIVNWKRTSAGLYFELDSRNLRSSCTVACQPRTRIRFTGACPFSRNFSRNPADCWSHRVITGSALPSYSWFPSRYTAESTTHRPRFRSCPTGCRVASRRYEKKSPARKREKRETNPYSSSLSFHSAFLFQVVLLTRSRFLAPFHFFFLNLCHPVSSTAYTFIRPTLFSSCQLPPPLPLLSPSLFSFSDCRDDDARRDKGAETCTKENDAGRYNGEFPTPSGVCTRLIQKVLLRWIIFSWMNDRDGQRFLHFPGKREMSINYFFLGN